MRAVRVHRPGGPEVMALEDLPVPSPGQGEVLIKVEWAGVNYADVGLRMGMMGGPHRLELPYTPGFEVAGTVEALGEGVEGFRPGDRVAAVMEAGGYAEYALAPADRTFKIPEGVDPAAATGMLVQGLTAYGLLHDSAQVKPGEWVLVLAAAGGVGSLAVQLAKLAGARVAGAAGSEGKLELVKTLGADLAVNYAEPGWGQRVAEATGGGVNAVLDSVGGRVGAEAFGSLAPFGRMVVFGGASGEPLPFPQLMMPMSMKALSLTGFGGPWLRPGRAQAAAAALAGYLAKGELRVEVQKFTLDQAPEAHRAVQERRTTGKVVLEV